MKAALVCFVAVLSLSISGCASMFDQMGMVTKDSMVARDKRLDAVEAKITDFSAKIDQIQGNAQRIAAVEDLMRSLQGRIDQLPDETLRKLAAILQQAVSQVPAAPVAAPAADSGDAQSPASTPAAK